MRTESKPGSEFHRRNSHLLNQLSSEKLILENQGYCIGYLGDFNSRITPSPRFNFRNYPHQQNNNGRLLQSFAETNDLFCLNPLNWHGRREERATYQRNMGSAGLHVSILDLGLCSSSAASIITDFKVTDDPELSTHSDHSSLVLEYRSKVFSRSQPVKEYNHFKDIVKWASYTKILEKRTRNKLEWFKSLTTDSQNTWLTNQFKAAGRSVLPIIPKHRAVKQHKLPKSSAESSKTKKLRKILRSAVNSKENKDQIRAKEDAWKLAKLKQHKYEALIHLKRKYRIRNIIAAKGKEGSRIFWNCLSNKKKTSAFIDVLNDGGKLVFDPAKKAKVIEKFFKTKFNTTDAPKPFNDEPVNEETLGTPKKKLSGQESRGIVKDITMKELNEALDTLNARKAEGLDNITNNMLKNTSLETRQLILELFNDVLLSGVNPKDWKVGHVILLLKRAPGDDIANYRPITLISCLSKVLSKILAKRITVAVESSGIAGDLQNGFRPGRNCSDNIFILNALLELNKSKKKLSYLLFVDLQAGFGII